MRTFFGILGVLIAAFTPLYSQQQGKWVQVDTLRAVKYMAILQINWNAKLERLGEKIFETVEVV